MLARVYVRGFAMLFHARMREASDCRCRFHGYSMETAILSGEEGTTHKSSRLCGGFSML